MALPATISVKINLSGGASFGNPFILGTSQLGFAELASSIPVIVDVSTSTLDISTRRGRNILQDNYESGSATIRIVDPNGDFNPQNTASPYFGLLQPLRKIQASAVYGGVTYGLFGGYITEYRYTYPTGQETGYCTFICYDAFRLMYNSNVTTVTGGTAGQTTAQRVQSILTMIAWPPAFTSIGTGATTVPGRPWYNTHSSSSNPDLLSSQSRARSTSMRMALQPLRVANIVYDAQAASPTVFNQIGTGINYAGITFALDDKTIVNKATVTRIGGTAQTYSDATSIAQYFTRSITATDMLMQTDANALSLATAYVDSRKETSIRIETITLDLVTPNYTAGVTAALSLDFFNTVDITNEQPGGSTIQKKLQVQGIAHNITPNTWTTTIATQEPLLDVMY
jgi:hypothetical protein